MRTINTPTHGIVLRDMLESRRRAFLKLPYEEQTVVDEERMVPTLEMHDLLDYFYKHGIFPDERKDNNANNYHGNHRNLVLSGAWYGVAV